MFEFLRGAALTRLDLVEIKTEFLIEGFLVKNAIQMIYSLEGDGKSFFSYALSKELLKNNAIKNIFYLDGDNGKKQLKERNVDQELMIDSRFHYVHHEKISVAPYTYIKSISREAKDDAFQDCVFFIDSLRDWVEDMDHKKRMKEEMGLYKKIRAAGGTIIIIHHLTKTGRRIEGSAEITRSIDNSHRLKQKGTTAGKIHYLLSADKKRDPIEDRAFSVSVGSLNLEPLDTVYENMSQEENSFVTKVTTILRKTAKGYNQTQLLKELGYDRTDRIARERLQKFTGLFWKATKEGKSYTYNTI